MESVDAIAIVRGLADVRRPRATRGVRSLELGYNLIDTVGANAIAHCIGTQWGADIEYLGLGGNRIETIEIPALPALRELVLECNDMSYSAMSHLLDRVDCGDFPRLNCLDMDDNRVCFAAARLYSRMEAFCAALTCSFHNGQANGLNELERATRNRLSKKKNMRLCSGARATRLIFWHTLATQSELSLFRNIALHATNGLHSLERPTLHSPMARRGLRVTAHSG